MASSERRLRIGYVSPDFRAHVVGANVLPLLREHDRTDFEVFCYVDVPHPDSITEKIRSQGSHWRDIQGVDDQTAAEMIRADQIDLLVDLALRTPRNRLPLFALEPAPVQVYYLGYCGTTGLDAIHYRLSDCHLDPENGDLSCYSERTVRLEHAYLCYQPLDLPELIADSRERYVQIATRLAADRPRLAELRANLRQRMEASPLRDSKGHARAVEKAFREMWRAWCAGK